MQTPTAIARSAAAALADGGTARDRAAASNPATRRFDAILHVIEVVLKDLGDADPATRVALTRLTEALARIVNLPQQPQESLKDFTRRLAAHMDALPPQARALIEKQLGQQSLLLALKMLVETLRPSLPIDIVIDLPAHHGEADPRPDEDTPGFRQPTIQVPLPIRPLQSHPSSVLTGTVKLQQALELAFSGEPHGTVPAAQTFVAADAGTADATLDFPASSPIDEPLPTFREATAFLASDPQAVAQVVAIATGQTDGDIATLLVDDTEPHAAGQPPLAVADHTESGLPIPGEAEAPEPFRAPPPASSAIIADPAADADHEPVPVQSRPVPPARTEVPQASRTSFQPSPALGGEGPGSEGPTRAFQPGANRPGQPDLLSRLTGTPPQPNAEPNHDRYEEPFHRADTAPGAPGIDDERPDRPQRAAASLPLAHHAAPERETPAARSYPLSDPHPATNPTSGPNLRPADTSQALARHDIIPPREPAQRMMPPPAASSLLPVVPETARETVEPGPAPRMGPMPKTGGMAETPATPKQGMPAERDADDALRPTAMEPDGLPSVASDRENRISARREPAPDAQDRRLDVAALPANVTLQSRSAMDVVSAIGQLDEWETLFYMLSGSLNEALPPDAEPARPHPSAPMPDGSPGSRTAVPPVPAVEARPADTTGGAAPERSFGQAARADDAPATVLPSYGPETIAVREAMAFAFVPYLPAPSRLATEEDENARRWMADDRQEDDGGEPGREQEPEGETPDDPDRTPPPTDGIDTEPGETEAGSGDAYALYRRLSGLG